ncbi:type III secretion system inner membrane ring lipoprotein SctJ [Bremerella sp. JC770]|uniref:type III secretion system inner membrane ring lipoprotein SctJ n=1 Tax=Bremerella sp. JC770 TaxID=3232137 RepID=UPI0034590B1E
MTRCQPQHRFLRSKLALLALLFATAVGCSQVDLYTGLPEREANEMMSILLDRGISCSKTVDKDGKTWTLSVPNEGFSESVHVLSQYGLPNDQHVSIGDVFQKTGLVSSPTEDRIRYVYALSEELAETVSRIDGVVDARVHVVLPDNEPFTEKTTASSASVYIKHRTDVDLTTEKLPIKALVAKSIEGLESENVEIFLDEVESLDLPATQSDVYSTVLGVRMSIHSVRQFWTLVGTISGVLVISLAAAGWLGWREYQRHLTSASEISEIPSIDSSQALHPTGSA